MERSTQQTILVSVSLSGIGVHSGEAATLTLHPAPPGHGIRFRRVDLPSSPEIRAELDAVTETDLGTTLGTDEVRVRTVEHVMAALSAEGIDNVTVDLDGPEAPIRDGSFRDFVELVRSAGVATQEAPVHPITLRDPISVTLPSGESYVAVPADSFRISTTIDFEHPVIGRRFGTFGIDREVFARDIAPARTFGFEPEAAALRERGLARGASFENTVVLGETEILTPGELRFEDEFLRHKVGDLVGDLALLGAPLHAHVIAERPSHRGNVALGRAIREKVRRGDGRAIVDARKIMEYLPHRFPMLLVDRVIDFESGKRIVGIKNVTINEPFFQGHYPGHPIMPGVLIIEAMAQVGGLLLMDAIDRPEDKVVYFMSLNNVKWRRPVVPGDQLVFELEMLQFRRHVCRMKGMAYVDGNLVSEAEFMARIMDR